jgi:Methyltransferase FkbM domain
MLTLWKAALARWQRPETPVSPFHHALERLLARGGTINILQVGANDGVINDPLYGFVHAHPDATRIILVEPQAELIPVLSGTYAFHPGKVIFQGAIGPAQRMTLHQVRKACWPDLVVPYAKDWPLYRAPSGVASGRRDMVLEWVGRHYKGPLPLDEVIEAVEVEVITTRSLLARVGLFERLDVLQIDAEGQDDLVIHASDIEGLRPRLIHFEVRHLGAERLGAVSAYLTGLGYLVERRGMNALAQLSG